MAFVAIPVAAAVGAWWYRRGPADEDGAEVDEDTPVVSADTEGDGALISKPKKSDKKSEGSGYVFGDLWSSRWFSSEDEFDAGAELETQLAAKAEQADERFDKVERLVRDAVVLYRARGYCGTISISQRVGVFTESCSIGVEPPIPTCSEPNEASDEPPAAACSEDKVVANAKAGRVFRTLFARLERRAVAWQRLSGVEGLDPMLSESAQIGFAMPVVNVGWGVSVTFSVQRSTLVSWLERAADEPEAETTSTATTA